MESWDDENFEPPAPTSVPVAANKWEGEDEEDEVKESWEDEDEEKKEEVKPESELKKPKKKSLAEKIAEKEEMKERERRANNIVVFNVPTSKATNNIKEKIEHDTIIIHALLSKLCSPDQIKEVFRIGQPGSKPRPIKVVMDNSETVLFILKNKRKINHPTAQISADSTPNQRNEFRELKEQLKRRISNGETNIAIRHVEGVPKIVNVINFTKEKLRQKREEMEKRLREQEEVEMTAEERLQRQKESDLKLALETTFGGEPVSSGIDDLNMPTTKEEFETFSDSLAKKLTPLSKSVEYPVFIENLTRNLCATMSSLDIKRIKNSLDNLYLEKQKIEKGDKAKKSKGKGKAKLKMEGDNQLSQLSAYVNDYDDYDDFM